MEVKDLLQWCMEANVSLRFTPVREKLHIDFFFEDSITVDQFFGFIEITGIKDTEINIDVTDGDFTLIISKFD